MHININHGLLTMLYYTIPMVFIKQQTSPWQRSLRLRRSAAVAQGLFKSQAAGFEAWDHHEGRGDWFLGDFYGEIMD